MSKYGDSIVDRYAQHRMALERSVHPLGSGKPYPAVEVAGPLRERFEQ